jgi:hypothetical protein
MLDDEEDDGRIFFETELSWLLKVYLSVDDDDDEL